MPKSACQGLAIKLCGVAALAGMLAACVLTIPVRPEFEEPPLSAQIQARVGSACRIPIHAAHYAESAGGGIAKIDFDRASLSRFEQVFRSLFSEVTTLAPWPPWREILPESLLDGVIELDAADLKLSLGDDLGHNPEHVEVRYRVCLYDAKATTVNCWESRAEQIHQRTAFERFNMVSYLETLVEATSREAIARFMLAFESDPVVKAWADQLAQRPGGQP